jgi:hypothetical protein
VGYEVSCLLVGVVSDWYVKVDYVNNVLDGWGPLRVASMELNNHIELTDVEEMADRLNLILSHIRSEYKSLHVEAVEEYFDSVSLNHVFSEDDSLALDNRHLEQAEHKDEPVETGLTKRVEMLCLLESIDSLLSFFSLIQFDNKGLSLSEESVLYRFKFGYLLLASCSSD